MRKIVLLTAHHKKDVAIPIFKRYFYPIQVGSALNEKDFGIERDDSGDNISWKNRSYCELTAYYYAYKNLCFDYAGLMHYRRVFSTRFFSLSDIKSFLFYFSRRVLDFFYIKDINLYLDNCVKVSSLNELDEECRQLKEYLYKGDFDVILPKKVSYAYVNMKNQYAINHCALHFQLFNDIIAKKYPKFSSVIYKVNKFKKIYPYNMFLMRREYYADYHKMLFEVLLEMEKNVDLNSLNSYQSRLFGFLSERFLNYYIELLRQDKNLKIKELRTIFIGESIS
jgi:hypothetical protein